MGGRTVVFLSYRTARAAEVAPLVAALERAGIEVWRDEARIDEAASIGREVRAGLASARALLAWYGEDYPTSRVCQWELATAWVAADAAQAAHDRVLIVVPPGTPTVDHVVGLARDHKVWRVEGDLEAFARDVAAHVSALDARTLGELAPLAEPPRWCLRPRMHPSERFIGRTRELWSLHTALHAERMVMVTGRGGPSTAQLRGLGGIGKTLLAVEYVARFGAAFPGGIFWVDSAERDPERLRLEVARALDLAEDEVAHVANVLAARGPYLWVVDDVPAAGAQREVEAWCAPTPNGHTLLTTRSRRWSALGTSLDLDILAPDEAYALLTARCAPPSGDESQAAHELCVELGRLPLALDVAGALVALQPGPAPYASFLARVRDTRDDVLALGEVLEEELPTGTGRSVSAVLRASLDGLRDDALDLLRLAVSLADAPVPAALALAVLGDRAEDRWTAGVSGCQARSLIALDADRKGYTVHALVRRALAFNGGEQDRIAALRRSAVDALPRLFAGVDDMAQHTVLTRLVSHVEHLAARLETPSDVGAPQLLAHYHLVRGAYVQAERWGRLALEAGTRLAGAEAPNTLAAMLNLATTLRMRGDLPGARALDEALLEIRTRMLGPDHIDTLASMQNLAGDLDAQGHHADAREILEMSLERLIRAHGEDHREVSTLLQNLSNVLLAQGRLDAARRTCERALEARARRFGDDHLETLGTMHNLANVLFEVGDFVGSRDRAQRVLEGRTSALGEEHPHTLGTMHVLARALSALGERDRPRALYERSLAVKRQSLGEEHPETLRTLQAYAVHLRAAGEHAASREIFARVLDQTERQCGPDHTDTISARQNLATSLLDSGEYAAALQAFEQARATAVRALGPAHPHTLTIIGNMAVTLFLATEHRGTAEAWMEHVLAERLRILGHEHPDTLTTLQNLAGAWLARGEHARAQHANEQVREARARLLGDEHPETLTALHNLAVAHQDPARFAQALDLRARVQGEAHPDTLKTIDVFAKYAADTGDFGRARQLLERALAARERALGPDHPATGATREQLARLGS